MPRIRPAPFRHRLAAAAMAMAIAPALAQAQECKLLALQQTPCQLVGAEVVASSLGVPQASLKAEDNVKFMGRMPELTTCIYNLSDGGEVRIGQIAPSSPQAFDQRYRSQTEAEIAAGMGAGTRQAEQAVGRSVSGAEKANAQAGAAALVRSMQFQPVAGLGEKASFMVSGSSPNAHLITLVKNQTFVVQVRANKATRERNLELAKPIATAIAARCR
jgi:hypothetical protein